MHFASLFRGNYFRRSSVRPARILRDGYHANKNLHYSDNGRRWRLQADGTWRSRGESAFIKPA